MLVHAPPAGLLHVLRPVFVVAHVGVHRVGDCHWRRHDQVSLPSSIQGKDEIIEKGAAITWKKVPEPRPALRNNGNSSPWKRKVSVYSMEVAVIAHLVHQIDRPEGLEADVPVPIAE